MCVCVQYLDFDVPEMRSKGARLYLACSESAFYLSFLPSDVGPSLSLHFPGGPSSLCPAESWSLIFHRVYSESLLSSRKSAEKDREKERGGPTYEKGGELGSRSMYEILFCKNENLRRLQKKIRWPILMISSAKKYFSFFLTAVLSDEKNKPAAA